MNKLINIILSGLLWRQYKFLIVSLLLLIVVIFIVGEVHEDYLAFAQTSEEDAQVGLSFMLKWGVWLLAIGIFLFANHLVNARKNKEKALSASNKSLLNILQFNRGKKPFNKAEKQTDNAQTHTGKNVETENDPFAHLRNKKKLRSYADLVIEKHDKAK